MTYLHENPDGDWRLVVLPFAATIICALLIVILKPLLVRYALARPNARSSHTIPTPQGGGIAVLAAVAAAIGWFAWSTLSSPGESILALLAAALIVAIIGMIDDLRPIPVVPRLAIQSVAVVTLLMALPPAGPIIPAIPNWLEHVAIGLALLWFINLVNFMDGLDWMTVAEIIPVCCALAGFALLGEAPAAIFPVAASLAGALLGFSFFNRPVAKLFLGDVGSLPIGLITGWCLLQLSEAGHLAAAILLPLYYLADATITLTRRMARGEAFWNAHRSHFYQRATVNGFSVIEIVTHVFSLNIVLAGLAAASIFANSTRADIGFLGLGAVAVACVLVRFSRAR